MVWGEMEEEAVMGVDVRIWVDQAGNAQAVGWIEDVGYALVTVDGSLSAEPIVVVPTYVLFP